MFFLEEPERGRGAERGGLVMWSRRERGRGGVEQHGATGRQITDGGHRTEVRTVATVRPMRTHFFN
jgi:hypothetical protein